MLISSTALSVLSHIACAAGMICKGTWNKEMAYDDELHMQEAVANFQPTSQDLDYPGKLQRLAEQPESALLLLRTTEQTPLVGAAVANGDSSSLVSLYIHCIQCRASSTPEMLGCLHSKYSKC